MSLNGKLEDVSLADVMQFIHLGRRTGTLSLTRGVEEAEIGFHRGQIVSAWGPGSVRLGELLTRQSLLSPAQMQEVLRQQASEQPRRSLGQILVQNGLLEFEQVRAVIEDQIQGTVYDLVTWTTGAFEFSLDELKPIDDIAMYPGDVIPKLNLNTQMLLLEASRIMDEAKRDEVKKKENEPKSGIYDRARRRPQIIEPEPLARGPPVRPPRGDGPFSSVAEMMDGVELDFPEAKDDLLPEAAHRRLQIVSPDRRLADELTQIIQPEIAQVVRVPLREAGTRLPGEPSPTIVVLDLRDGHHTIEDLLAIRRSRPSSSAIAVVDTPELTTQAFEAGAVAALSAEPRSIAACFHSLVRTLQDMSPTTSARTQRAGFARLRRVLADIRSGLLSATMALNLMHIISRVGRAGRALPGAGRIRLVALGAFGFSLQGKPLAEATSQLELKLDIDTAFSRCIADGQPRSLTFEQARLPDRLAKLLGRPKNGQVVVFPVMGAERVISVVYTDNGNSSRAIEDIELLELATAQVGVAFENELLRRQIERS